jgi:hypothetical protein
MLSLPPTIPSLITSGEIHTAFKIVYLLMEKVTHLVRGKISLRGWERGFVWGEGITLCFVTLSYVTFVGGRDYVMLHYIKLHYISMYSV